VVSGKDGDAAPILDALGHVAGQALRQSAGPQS
jgi:hypothetical protein